MTYNDLLNQAKAFILEHDLEPTVAKLFILKYSGLSYSQIILNLNKEVDSSIVDKVLWAIGEYTVKKRPPQYIINEQSFYGRVFYVDEHVLIPRWETEELVSHVIDYINMNYSNKKVDILDVGTGSGCISITLAKEADKTNISAVDISQQALNIAQKNSEYHNADVHLILSDLFSNVKTQFDIIVSNPPYIPNQGSIGVTVDKEPPLALYGGDLGVDIIERMFIESKPHLKDKFLIALEHGYDQNELIYALATKHFEAINITQIKDSSGKDRFTFIERK